MVQTFRTNVFVELYIVSESEEKARAAKVNAVNVIPDAVITSPRIFAPDTSRRFWLKGKKNEYSVMLFVNIMLLFQSKPTSGLMRPAIEIVKQYVLKASYTCQTMTKPLATIDVNAAIEFKRDITVYICMYAKCY